MTKYVGLHFARSGLCNRLRTLAGALAVGQILRVPVRMLWIETITCPGVFGDLFEIPEGVRIVYRPSPTDAQSLVGGKWHAETVAQSFFPFVEDVTSESDYYAAWQNVVRSLSPVPAILDCVRRFVKSEWPDLEVESSRQVVGVHVRRTDLVADMMAHKKIRIDDELMFARLDSLIVETDCRLFLAADSEAARAPYRKRYGGRLFYRPVKMKHLAPDSRARHTSLADAVVDLWLLAACSRIVGTYGSSFSSFAGIVGGIPVERLGGEEISDGES